MVEGEVRDVLSEVSAESVEEQLYRLRSSPLFSHSRRYPVFLEYVVRKTLEGKSDELKERIIGIEVFGRTSDYDLSTDPVVRTSAGEVRKRLAQYYYDSTHRDELRIELYPGSYIPEFKWAGDLRGETVSRPATLRVSVNSGEAQADISEVTAMPSQVGAQIAGLDLVVRLRLWKALSAVLMCAFLIALVIEPHALMRRPSLVDSFWKPITGANGPVIISVGSVAAMVNGNAKAPPSYTVSGHPLSSDPIAVSDATALSSIQQVLSTRSKASSLESSTSTSFADLQKGPVVLIAGFNNQWTMRLTKSLRFHFVRSSTDEYRIEDLREPANHQWEINTAAPFTQMDTDFGIAARFLDPTTEQIVIVAAGIGENGTVAASRLLTDEKYLQELNRNRELPRADQNFEAIVETRVIDGRPGPPRIVAVYTW